METPYRALSFKKHEIISRDKVDQLESDYQWINDNTPRGRFYRENSNPKETLLVVLAGRVKINRNRKTDDGKVSVKFGKAFDGNCRPNVTTGIVADWQTQIHCVVNGPKGHLLPDDTGCEIRVNIAADSTAHKMDTIKKDFWVHWSAMGYRRFDMNEF